MQPDALSLELAGGNVWVVLDDLPAEISPSNMFRLFTFLDEHVQQTEDSPFADFDDDTPVVIRFVPETNGHQRFPNGTEDFAGLVGRAYWRCVPGSSGHNRRRCWPSGNEPTQEANEAHNIILIAVRVQPDIDLTVGYLTHELSHVLGAVDGLRCPANEEYRLTAPLVPDPQDAYWWFGVAGFFDLKPSGIAWAAMNDRCAKTKRPGLCNDLRDILSDFKYP